MWHINTAMEKYKTSMKYSLVQLMEIESVETYYGFLVHVNSKTELRVLIKNITGNLQDKREIVFQFSGFSNVIVFIQP